MTHQAPIAARTADGRALVGVIGLDGDLSSTGIPLTIAGQHRLDHKVTYRCVMHRARSVLTVETSEFALHLPSNRSPVVRLDYVRDRSWAPSHVQLHAESSAIGHIRAHAGERAETWRLHLPTGTRRFRPALEDVIEFTIVEFGVDCHDGYAEIIATSRDQWETVQLEAAIRGLVHKDPERNTPTLRRAISEAKRAATSA